MWLNDEQLMDSSIKRYRDSLLSSCPNHIVIDNIFNEAKLDDVIETLQNSHCWKTQQHTYSALYVDSAQWQKTSNQERFVQRDSWQPDALNSNSDNSNIAQDLLSFLRTDEFMSVLSRIFNEPLTDINVADPDVNTNYFRLGPADFVEQHADDSPGRKVCMLLYLNKHWNNNAGGELVFIGSDDASISIAPLYNRCVLFNPASKGSEHWVARVNAEYANQYRYNVTSWYWSE